MRPRKPGDVHADPDAIAAQNLSRPSRARRACLSVLADRQARGVLSARAVPVHRERPARMACERGRRHGPRHHGRASARRRAVQRGAGRLRRRLPADEPRRGHPARRREDRHARALPRASPRRRGAALSGVRAGGQAMSGLKRGGAAIVGAAESDLGKVAEEMSPLDLMAQGTHRALADCGASLKDVDGLFCATAQARLSVLALAEYLGLQPAYIGSTDGGGAIIITSAERARSFKKPPVYVLGCGQSITHNAISSMPDLTVTGAVASGKEAYAMAKLGPTDVDAVELYDAFTLNTMLFLEDLGFCKKGEGGAFVSDGRIAPKGALPVNTNGGGLSYCHPGMYGLFVLIEAVRQLRGECGARQVKDCEVAIAHGNGGVLSSQATVILGNQATV